MTAERFPSWARQSPIQWKPRKAKPMTAEAHSIEEQAQALATNMAAQAPADLVAPFRAEQADLDAAGVPTAVAKPGSALPDGELLDAHGAPVTLAWVRAGRPAVVVFYRGAWCPYCNIALRTYQSGLLPELAVRGVELIAVSPQKPDGSLTAQQTNELTYWVLSDPGNQIASRLGNSDRADTGCRCLTSQTGAGPDRGQRRRDAGASHAYHRRCGGEGTIRWIDVHPNYTTRSEVPDMLAAVEAVGG